MTWFLLKGLLRDRHRSLFPVIIVAMGVMLVVVLTCWIKGFVVDLTSTSAKLDTGHVKIMTRAYAELSDQLPNDLALSEVSTLLADLRRQYPGLDWTPRIKFGGLLDIPDTQGETRAQGPVFGIAVNLLASDSQERARLNLDKALVQGHLPRAAGEILISAQLAQNLKVRVGETATLISATSRGSMAIQNFRVAGTIRFGVGAMDRNAILADITDLQYALDMADAAGEVLGFFPKLIYQEQTANEITAAFNAQHAATDQFAPMMLTLKQQNGLGAYLDLVNVLIFIFITVFIGIMSIVLWNTGLMSGIRRYGEIGVRLAMGESKGHIYRLLIYEAMLIGLIGSVIGTAIGLGFALYLQEVGFDVSNMMKSATMLMSTVMRARVTLADCFIGFIPGVLATTFGALMSGIGVFKRQTAQLFKELEA
jgi:putative ABC transport system permease protein